jgi:hypothetical protein
LVKHVAIVSLYCINVLKFKNYINIYKRTIFFIFFFMIELLLQKKIQYLIILNVWKTLFSSNFRITLTVFKIEGSGLEYIVNIVVQSILVAHLKSSHD